MDAERRKHVERLFQSTLDLPPDQRVKFGGPVYWRQWFLRWDAPKETAYPATFVIGRDGTIHFANVSLEHGGRTPVAEVLKALGKEMR